MAKYKTKFKRFRLLPGIAALITIVAQFAWVGLQAMPATAEASNSKLFFTIWDSITNSSSLMSSVPNGTALSEVALLDYGSVSPDGTQVVYGQGADIYKANIDGSNPTSIFHVNPVDGDGVDIFATWSPDGTKIAFFVFDATYKVYIMDADGSNAYFVANGGIPSNPIAWSPDGQKIAFEYMARMGDPGVQLAIVNINGTGMFLLPQEESNRATPSWSPDGRKLAFASSTSSPRKSTISTVNIDGTDKTDVYTFSDMSGGGYPVWSPDGSSIAFIETQSLGGEGKIIAIPSEGGMPSVAHDFTGSGKYVGFLQWWGTASSNPDTTPPTLTPPTWTTNPKPTTGTTTLTVPATDNLSGITKAEYFIGDTDPGRGNGATMTLANQQTNGSGAVIAADLTTTFGADFPTGVYKISVRAQDVAGNWSDPVSDYLVVYDTNGPKFTGKRTIIPSLGNNDNLPGLIAADQADKAKFGFSVKYNNQGQISNNSDLQFTYSTGTHCKNPNRATNCHDLSLNATNIAWLTTEGTNNSTGIFQGTATMIIDGQTSTVLFRVTGIDGERLSPTATDQFQIQIFNQGDNPNTATPIYRVNSADIARGNIKIQ